MNRIFAVLPFFLLSACLSWAQSSTVQVRETKSRRTSQATTTDIRAGGLELTGKVATQPALESLAAATPVLLDRHTTKKVYGTAVANSTLAIQVTVMNFSEEFDFLIHAITLRAKDLNLNLTAMDKRIIQAIGQRGQTDDPRNRWLRALTGIGSALVPFPTFINVGNSFLPAVAAFNGPGLSAFNLVFPDHTVNQMIRISNHALESNQVVPKEKATNVTIFVPINMMLSKTDVELFANDPFAVYQKIVKQFEVRVDGVFVEAVDTPDAFAILGAKYDATTHTIEISGAGFLPTDTVSIREGANAADVLSEPEVKYGDGKSLSVVVPEKYGDKFVRIVVIRKDGSAKSNIYGWELK